MAAKRSWDAPRPISRQHERRRRRQKSIDRFAEQQRVKRDWIALSDIADSCASTTTTASAAAQEDARALAWLLLDRSARNGEFEQQRTSKILDLDPWLNRDGKRVPCRLQSEQLAFIEHLRDLPLSRWLPREVARRWLLAHGYPWPAHFEPATISCISSVGEGYGGAHRAGGRERPSTERGQARRQGRRGAPRAKAPTRANIDSGQDKGSG